MNEKIFNPEYCKVCIHKKYCKKYMKNSIKIDGCLNFKQEDGTAIFF